MSTTATLGLAVVCLVGLALLAASVRRAAGTDDDPPTERADDGVPTATAAEGPTPDGRSESTPSDEEVVFDLLDAADGQLPQTDVVSDTDWSKSKVSRVLARMDDEGTITKIDIGRGNVITRRGEEPPGAARPFEN